MNLRVLHVLDHSLPLQSGYTFRTRSILREQQRLGWQTFQVTSPKHVAPGPDEEEIDGLHFFRTRWEPKGLARAPIVRELGLMRAVDHRIEEIVARVRPDLLHAHSPVLNAIPALRVGRRHRIPVVYEVRAFWEDAAADHGTSREGGWRYRATRALETYALKRASHITTICEGLRADIVARGIPAERVTVIPNAVEPEAFPYDAPADRLLKTELGLSDCTVIGFVGSFYAYEGLDLLIDAVPHILAARPDARLLLVGGGPQEAALRDQVERLGLGHVVVFAGRVPHSEISRYYSVIDVFAFPRKSMRLTELVTPLKPLEAMAQGRLLVASDVGGHRELIRDGETGMLFEAESVQALVAAVLRMLDVGERRHEIRAAGRRFVETERTWQRSVARYVPIFCRLAETVGRDAMLPATLRVVLVGPIPPPAGGMAMQTAQLARLLRDDLSVEIVPVNPPYPTDWIARMRGVRAVVRLIGTLPRLARAARASDVMHVMANSGLSWDLFAVPAILVARLFGRPVVVNYRGGEAADFLKRAHRRVRVVLRLAGAVAVPSSFLREVFAVHALPTRIVPNIIDTARFHPDADHRLFTAAPHIVIARNLEALYGIDVALDAFARLRETMPAARLTITGVGPLKTRLEAHANALGIADFVLFAGRRDADDIASLLRGADLALNPSRADNMPNSVLEAWASGVPVVSTNVGGVPYFARDGATAVLVPPDDASAMADAMRRVLTQPDLWRALRANGLTEAQRYTWAKVKPLWIGLYRELLGARAETLKT